MTLLRRIFFYLFVAVYLVVTPFVILYALGIIYRPNAVDGNRILKTGLIHFDTLPPGATITLEGRRFHEQTPTIIRDLIPGAYLAQLTLPGYRRWSRMVTVEPEKAAVFDHILFLPEIFATEKLLTDTFRDLQEVNHARYLLLTQGEPAGQYRVYDTREKNSHLLFTGSLSARFNQVIKIYTVPESSIIVVVLNQGNGDRPTFLRMDLENPESPATDLTSLIRPDAENIFWAAREPEVLFVQSGTSLDKVSVSLMTCQAEFIKGIKGIGLFDNMVYYLSGANRILQKGYDSKKSQTLEEDSDTLNLLFGDATALTMTFLSADLVLFLNEKGGLVTNRLPYQFVKRGVLGFRANPKKDKVVLWQSDRVGIMDFQRPEKVPVLFEAGPRVRWLPLTYKQVKTVFWAFEDSHLIVQDEEKLSLVALEEGESVSSRDLLSIKAGTQAAYQEEEGSLYYLEAGQGNLVCVPLIPKRELFSLPRSEKPFTGQEAAPNEL